MISKETNINSSGSVDDETLIVGEAKFNLKNERDTNSDIDTVAGEPKRMRRHTPAQIQEMDKLFKDTRCPDDQQRKELAATLGMDPLQVKYWFQNKRNQMKTQREHAENVQLRQEIAQLKNDKMKLEAMCNGAGGHSTHVDGMSREEFRRLKMENVMLRKDMDRISRIAAGASNIGKKPVSRP